MNKSKKVTLIISFIIAIAVLVVLLVLWYRNAASLREADAERLRKLGIDEEVYKEESRINTEFAEKNPLADYTPYISDEFEIYRSNLDPRTGIESYVVYLKPRLAPGESGYEKEINDLVERASDWISSKGADVDDLSIEWTTDDPGIEPPE